MDESFDLEAFKNTLRTSWIGSECLYFETLPSTNSYGKSIKSEELVHGSVIITDVQNRGRGQYEKKWESEPYKNLTFTLCLKPVSGDRLSLLTLACALSVCKAVESFTGESAVIKWPNDIYHKNKKLGGILTECIFSGERPDRVLIGIGLNINQKIFGKKLDGDVVSVSQLSNSTLSRESFLSSILLYIEQLYIQWHKREIDLQRDVNGKLIGYGEWVHLSINGVKTDDTYKCLGVGESGELLMLNQQLDVNTFRHEQIRIIPTE
jgi:BirA family biotin operon repressor/biotin-[acetyl-CoA-carboxylase] ligase